MESVREWTRHEHDEAAEKERHGYARFLTNPYAVALALSLVGFFVMMDGQMSNDEGIWNYMARAWCDDGIPPYAGTVENKTPGIFELFAFSHLLFGNDYYFVRALGVMAVSVSSLVIYLMGKKLHSPASGLFSMVIFGLTMAWGALEGPHISQTETFMDLFSIMSFSFVIRNAESGKWRQWALMAGMSMGLAITFKQIAVTTACGLALFFVIYNAGKVLSRRNAEGLALMAIGAVVPVVATYLPLLASGVTVRDYLDSAWLILMNQGSHTQTVRHMREFLRVFANSKLAVFYPFLLLLGMQRGLIRDRYFMGLLVWLLFDSIGTNASGYYFGHQIKQLIPSLSLIVGVLLANLLMARVADRSALPRHAGMTAAALVLLLFPYDVFVENACHMVHFDRTKVLAVELGTWVREHTSGQDYVFIAAGGGNPILAYSERLSPSRYFNTLFVTSTREKDLLLSDIRSKAPLYILRSRRDPFYKNIRGEVEGYINSHYRLIYSFFEYDILKRSPP